TVLLANRDKLDLVAMYDDVSNAMGDPYSPVASLFRVICETVFRKILKNMPRPLIGSLQTCK
ncbi:hypothetical protein BV20DRAFT_911556, partial [Pilatotrama ljubarskyi]